MERANKTELTELSEEDVDKVTGGFGWCITIKLATFDVSMSFGPGVPGHIYYYDP